MTPKSVMILVGIYLLLALTFAGILVTFISSGASEVRMVSETIGGGLTLFFASGLLPILGWALMRFRLDRAEGPLFAWLALGIVAAYFAATGSLGYQARAQQPNWTAKQQADFIASARYNCVRNQYKELAGTGLKVSDARIAAYCECFAGVAAQAVTRAELEFGEISGRQSPSFAEKQGVIAKLCLTKTDGL